tara:strand:- start:1168 stop:1725 length:558 start_codon:yes stop_codon:yes gene_type:complete
MSVFNKLNAISVNDKTEKKKNLTYLSWAWAWAETKKVAPDATYKIWKDDGGNPYTYNETLGYMCCTSVTIEGETLEMWLPVMNGANKAMLNKPYEYKTKYDTKTVEAASMFDINKTIMRCLVKNLAMFGLGLYIYAGEDLPDVDSEDLLNNCKTLKDLQRVYTSLSSGDKTKYLGLKDELKNKLK